MDGADRREGVESDGSQETVQNTHKGHKTRSGSRHGLWRSGEGPGGLAGLFLTVWMASLIAWRRAVGVGAGWSTLPEGLECILSASGHLVVQRQKRRPS